MAGRGYSLVRWGPSFAGAISTIAVTAMGMALWWGIGYGSQVTFVTTNMAWFFLGTVLASLLIGGGVAGRVAGLRSLGIGLFDGVTVWALTLVAVLIPLSLRGLALANDGVSNPVRATAFRISSGDTWALFGAVAGGLLCAVVGAVTGSARKPSARTSGTVYEHRAEATAERLEHRAG